MAKWRKLARWGLSGMQKTVWSNEPLQLQKVQDILRVYDPEAEVIRSYYSWSCQAFEVTFRGRRCVAKFAGRDFRWKFVLQQEVARLSRLQEAGVRVPEVLLAEVTRLRYPFYIMPHLGESEHDGWDMTRREQKWQAEADLIRDYSDVVKRARLTCTSLRRSEEIARNEIARTSAGLRDVGLPVSDYRQLMQDYENVIFSRPWVAGQWQAPIFLHDGSTCWAIDWTDTMMMPPTRWVMDYTLYQRVNNPSVGDRHLQFLVRKLRGDAKAEQTTVEITIMQRFKVLSDGLGLIRRENNWEYFDVMHQRLFGVPLPPRAAVT